MKMPSVLFEPGLCFAMNSFLNKIINRKRHIVQGKTRQLNKQNEIKEISKNT